MSLAKPWTLSDRETISEKYRCNLLYSDVATPEANNNRLPSDSFLVYYADEEGDKVDICRGSRMVDIFDLYYDRFGPNISKIEFTKGRVNPKIWGETNKKK